MPPRPLRMRTLIQAHIMTISFYFYFSSILEFASGTRFNFLLKERHCEVLKLSYIILFHFVAFINFLVLCAMYIIYLTIWNMCNELIKFSIRTTQRNINGTSEHGTIYRFAIKRSRSIEIICKHIKGVRISLINLASNYADGY